MKRYFLDTNILLDFLGDRKPFGKYALRVFDQARRKEWELWTSDNAITTTYYVMEKEVGEEVARNKLGLLLKYLEIQAVGKPELQAALIAPFPDYEDAVQHACALGIERLNGIITRNRRDFKHSQLPVFGPEELFE